MQPESKNPDSPPKNMSGTLNNVKQDETPALFTPPPNENENSGAGAGGGVSATALEDDGHQPGATAFADEIRALKMKIFQLERQAKDNPTSSDHERPRSTPMDDQEEFRRMEECLYKHRKEWESNVGPGVWKGRDFIQDRDLKFGDQRWRMEFLDLDVERQFVRPDHFDPDHDCGARQGETENDYDREIDFGGRRDRVRKYYEWELDRLFLAEEFDKRRRDELREEERKKARERRRAEVKEKLQESGAKEQGEGDQDGNAEAAMKAAQLSVFAKPKLNWLGWPLFRRLARQEEQEACVLDILIGEPILDDERASKWLWFGSSGPGRRSHKLRQGKPTDSVVPEKGVLPERIRIHSEALLQILAIVLGVNFSALDETDNASAVLLRPFKALVYRGQALRDWCAALERKLEETGSGDGEAEAEAEATTASSRQRAEVDDSDDNDDDDDGEKSDEDDEDDEESEDGEEGKGAKGGRAGRRGRRPRENDLTRSVVALEHLRSLLSFMDRTIEAKKTLLHDPQSRKVIFNDLWFLFRPGTEVIGSDGKQAYRVIGVTTARHRVAQAWEKWYNPNTDHTGRRTQPPVRVSCVHIDFDGKDVGPVVTVFDFQRFDGERDVTTLDVYPLRFHPVKQSDFGEAEWRELEHVPPHEKYRWKLIRRGRQFLDVAAVKHMYYAGPTLDVQDEVESPVVVDFETTFARKDEQLKSERDIFQPPIPYPPPPGPPRMQDDLPVPQKSWKPKLRTLIGNPPPELLDDRECRADCCRNDYVHDDAYVDGRQRSEYIASLLPKVGAVDERPPVAIIPRPLKELSTDPHGVSEEDLVIMSYRVFGFVLRSRKWAKLDLSYLTDVHTPETPAAVSSVPRGSQSLEKEKPVTAFDRLVLEKGHQSMIVSLIAQHFRDKKSAAGNREEFDIVKGKGKGLILLLHGAPGVGKTSTAEGVAELFKKPLFQITCGDLGTTASEVEHALEENFSLANRWDCILLLDEADVFLAERTKEDFKRNGLVAVFLRLMEYYAGILFLTTNRVGDFDEAFTSRIHVSLYYPELNSRKTVEVFKINLDMIEDRFRKKHRVIKLDRMSIANFASQHFMEHPHARWNGRQIRNACQTALALAEFDAQRKSLDEAEQPDTVVSLDVEHFMIVRDAYLEFTKYMHDVYGANSARKAKEARLRAIWVDENNNIVGGTGIDKKKDFLLSTQGRPAANYPPQPSAPQAPHQAFYPPQGGLQQAGLNHPQHQHQHYHPQNQQNQNFGPAQAHYPIDLTSTQQFSGGHNRNPGPAGTNFVRVQEPSREPTPQPTAQQQQQTQQHRPRPSQEWLNAEIGNLYASGQQGAGGLPSSGEAGYAPGPGPGPPGPSSWQ